MPFKPVNRCRRRLCKLKVLVLGGTGAMGSFLVPRLAQKKYEVFVTTRSHDICVNQKKESSIHYICGNAHDDAFITPLVNRGWDCIVDFMVYHTAEFARRHMLFLDNAKQYIFLSSSRVYANSELPITEESPRLLDICGDKKYLATDEYALAKARQENILKNCICNNWTVVRPYITYSEKRMQLGVLEKEYWLNRALKGIPIVFSRDIAIKKTCMTYGDDVARILAVIVGNDQTLGECYHIVTPETKLWRDILGIYCCSIEECTGKRPEVHWLKNMDKIERLMGNHYQIYCDRLYDRAFDVDKITKFLAHTNEICYFKPIEKGLRECITNFINNL